MAEPDGPDRPFSRFDVAWLVRGNGDVTHTPPENADLLVRTHQSAGIGSWDFDLIAGVTRGTPQFFRNMGLQPTTEAVPIERIRALRHPDDRDGVLAGFNKAMAEGLDFYETEYRVVRPDGEVRWLLGRGKVIRAVDGRPVRYIGVDIDITDRKRAEDALRESEERFSKAFHAAAHPMSISTLKEGRYLDMNAAALAAAGRSREEVIGHTVQELGFYERPDQFHAVRDLLARHGHFNDVETNLRGADGIRTFLLSGARIELRGEPCLLISAIDITARKKAEEHVALLMQEVNHRANNLLAVVQAIVHQTARSANPATFADRLSQRIAALAASNRLLVSSKWQGVDMEALARSQMAHLHDLIGARILLDGPSLRLEPPAAQAIGMALHELATNAGKYGALSNARGRVRLAWHVAGTGDARLFQVDWSEQDGPVVRTPERTGFGHTVMLKLIEQSLDGHASLEFAPDGVVWRFTCPADQALQNTP
jgi:PAS domain S-box-containing protein